MYRLKLSRILPLIATVALLLPAVSACIKDDEKDYSEWKKRNEAFVDECRSAVTPDGKPEYESYSPVWLGSSQFVLIKYHTRPVGYADSIHPMDNSTVDIKYQGMLMDSTVFDNSYNRTADGDSIYRCRPNAMIPGFWATLTHLVPGDSVTVVIPARLGYGVSGTTGIPPYSALIFDIKMKRIVSLLE